MELLDCSCKSRRLVLAVLALGFCITALYGTGLLDSLPADSGNKLLVVWRSGLWESGGRGDGGLEA
jgi:hypothetical protein